jgi:glycosyltransferase 2 family protein
MTAKKIFSFIIKFGITIGIFYYLINSGKLNFQKLSVFWEKPIILIILLIVFGLIIVPICTVRWWFLLKALSLNVPLSRSFLLTWIGNFFNTTLPGAVSGDFVKGYYVIKANNNEEKTKAFMTLIIDRFTGLFGLIVLAFMTLVFNFHIIFDQPNLQPLAFSIIGLFLGTVVFYVIVLFPFKEGKDPFIKVIKKLPKQETFLKIYTTFKVYQNHKKILFWTLFLSTIVHFLVATAFFIIIQTLGIENVHFATQMFIMPIGLITIAIPVAPGGIGVGHVAFDTLYQMVGVSGGADIFNLFVIIQLSVYLLGGVVYFIYNNEYKLPGPDQKKDW